MFLVLLRFSQNKDGAGAFMADHNAWIARGFERGQFLMTGGLKPGLGGAVLAAGMTRAELEGLVAEDPFVRHDVVVPEVLEITPGRLDPRLDFLAA